MLAAIVDGPAMSHDASSNRVWYELSRVCVRFGAAAAFRIRYSGRENVPKTGGVLVVSNHQSHLDPPLIGAGFPRMLNYLARQSLFRFPLFARLIRSYGAIPIDLEGTGLSGLKETLKRLKGGQAVLMFPEGTRSPDGRIGPFLPGYCTLAVRSRAAILPVAIEGAFDAWPRWRKLPRTGVVHVHYGLPLRPDEVRAMAEADLMAEVERRVRQCHAKLRDRAVFRVARSRQ